MCFIRLWNTGLTHRHVALMLSQNSIVGTLTTTPTSDSRLRNQMIFEVAFATALYSVSVEERETNIFCDDFHEIIFPLRTSGRGRSEVPGNFTLVGSF
ncbi:hypothetical protein Tco_1576120 [Tanacetum coccineum]